jgi:ATP-binding cassette subfamily B protein
MKEVPNKLFSFIVTFLRPYRWHFATLVILTLFAGLISSIETMLLRHMLNCVAAGISENFVGIMQIAGLYGLWWLVVGLQWRSYEYIYMKTFPCLESDIVHKLFDYTERHSHRFFQEHFAGGISNRVIEMGENVCKILTMLLEQFGRKFFTILFTFVTLLSVHPYLGTIFFCWMFVLLGLNFATAGIVGEHSTEFARSKTRIFSQVVDSIANILNVKLFARNDYESSYIKMGLDDMVEKDHKFHMTMLKLRFAETLFCVTYITSILMCTLKLYNQKLVSVGDFALVIGLSMTVVDYVWGLTQELGEFEKALGSSRTALGVLSIPHDMQDPADSTPLIVTKGAIEFRDVNFTHTKKGVLFENLTITIPGGQKVGLVGFSGSGKTTFINLIIRLYDVIQGGIFIDNQDIATVTQQSLRENMSVIPQNPQLFHRTIIENIRYGNPKATDEQVMQAAQAAFAHEFIKKAEGGYYSFAGERGLRLSGGQVQRITIARAILKNAPILILDEATSALDSVTEHEIQESFDSLMKEKTVLVIAHRISTLLHMDRILVFDKGKIVGDGSHEELLKDQGSLYAKLWNSQVNGFLWHTDDE